MNPELKEREIKVQNEEGVWKPFDKDLDYRTELFNYMKKLNVKILDKWILSYSQEDAYRLLIEYTTKHPITLRLINPIFLKTKPYPLTTNRPSAIPFTNSQIEKYCKNQANVCPTTLNLHADQNKEVVCIRYCYQNFEKWLTHLLSHLSISSYQFYNKETLELIPLQYAELYAKTIIEIKIDFLTYYYNWVEKKWFNHKHKVMSIHELINDIFIMIRFYANTSFIIDEDILILKIRFTIPNLQIKQSMVTSITSGYPLYVPVQSENSNSLFFELELYFSFFVYGERLEIPKYKWNPMIESCFNLKDPLSQEETKEIELTDKITFISPLGKTVCLNRFFLQNYWKDKPSRDNSVVSGVIWVDCKAIKTSENIYETENEFEHCKPYWTIPGDTSYYVDETSRDFILEVLAKTNLGQNPTFQLIFEQRRIQGRIAKYHRVSEAPYMLIQTYLVTLLNTFTDKEKSLIGENLSRFTVFVPTHYDLSIYKLFYSINPLRSSIGSIESIEMIQGKDGIFRFLQNPILLPKDTINEWILPTDVQLSINELKEVGKNAHDSTVTTPIKGSRTNPLLFNNDATKTQAIKHQILARIIIIANPPYLQPPFPDL